MLFSNLQQFWMQTVLFLYSFLVFFSFFFLVQLHFSIHSTLTSLSLSIFFSVEGPTFFFQRRAISTIQTNFFRLLNFSIKLLFLLSFSFFLSFFLLSSWRTNVLFQCRTIRTIQTEHSPSKRHCSPILHHVTWQFRVHSKSLPRNDSQRIPGKLHACEKFREKIDFGAKFFREFSAACGADWHHVWFARETWSFVRWSYSFCQ